MRSRLPSDAAGGSGLSGPFTEPCGDEGNLAVRATAAFSGLTELGWDPGWTSALVDLGDPDLWPARVSRVDRGVCTVMTGSAEVRLVTQRHLDVAVGDWVGVAGSAGDGTALIAGVLPRRAVFRRSVGKGPGWQVVAANIDTVFLCDAVDGRLGLRHLERFLALAWQSGATPVVVVTKSDALPLHFVTDAVEAVQAVAREIRVVVVSARTGDGVFALAPYLLPGRTVALLGLSGAGKSTLANLLVGAEILATGAVRRDGSGRHTTTHRQLVPLPQGGLLIDTPGMRGLSVLGAGGGVEQAFGDVEALTGSCRYPNCSHSGDSGCALTAAVAGGHLSPVRLEAWLRLRPELAPSRANDDRIDIAERKRRKSAKFAARRASNK